MFKTKIPSTISFAIGILLFFMPFVDIKCNNMSLQKINGVEFATGFRIKTSDNSLLGNMENMNMGNDRLDNSGKRKEPNIYAMAALGLGILGFLLALLAGRSGGIGGLLTGSLAAISLIALWIDIKKEIKTEITGSNASNGINISVEFMPVFYIAVIVFLAAAYFSYKRLKGS
jgi:hypothetical protein